MMDESFVWLADLDRSEISENRSSILNQGL